jgi:AraC-like DNA-binding protein
VERLQASGGRAAIRGLSAELGCSPRYLESRVQEEAGLTPKRLARLIRFSHAVEGLRAEARAGIGELAHACGYYDQAHFNRDFRDFAGVAPGVYLATRDSSSQVMLVE